MSFTIEQKVGKHIYVYEVTSYWDKEKQQPRQKRVCIGKKDEKTNKIIPSKIKACPRISKDYGIVYFLRNISDKVGLTSVLQEIFPENWERILECALFGVSERKPLYLCQSWAKTTYVKSTQKSLSSQRLSELLHKMGMEDKKRFDFFKAWARKRAEKEFIAFDITSISSYSKLIETLEYGYNRDKEDMPQINLGMLFGQTSFLPVFYNIYQGSIRDVATLKNMIQFTEFLKIKKVCYVMDKGFYSEQNILEMIEKRLKFHIAVPFTTNLSKNIVEENEDQISSSQNSLLIKGGIVYGLMKTVYFEDKKINAFLFLDEGKRLESKEVFLKKILIAEDKIKKGISDKEVEKYEKYLFVKKLKNGYKIKRRDKKIREALRYKGYIVIISDRISNPKEAMILYRAKDVVERSFDNLKNELDMKRLRVHSDMNMAGRLFISFIELILYSWIDRVMQEKGLYKSYSQEQLLYELRRLKIIEFTDGRIMFTELSKKQGEIFKSFKMSPPTKT